MSCCGQLKRAAPQAVTRHGKEVAVVMDFESSGRLRRQPADFKAYLAGCPYPEEFEIVRGEATAPVVNIT